MNLTPAKAARQVGEFWVKQGKKRQRLFLVLVAGTIALCILIAAFLNHTTYTVLYSGLSSDEAGEILAKLDEMSVKTKIKDENTILVPEADEARLKMQLAADGYPQSAQNYDLFSQNVDFMTTDYEKQQYLIFQLQNRLQDAIETLDGVRSAIVTISVPEDDSYVLAEDKTPATASVVLDLSYAAVLDKQQIKGIEYLVANSVPGLDRTNVAIIDSNASLLNSPENDSAVSADKLSIEASINQTVEAKVIKLLQPVFGYEAIRVAVNTTVDVNQKVSQEKTYNPSVGNNGIVSNQDLTQENNGGTDGASGVPGTASNTGTTVYGEAGTGETSQSGSSSSSTDYLVNEYTEQVEKNGYEIKAITVSVMIGKPGISDDEVKKYKQAVAFAAGVSEDQISITTAEFLSLASDSTSGENAEGTGFDLFGKIKEKPLYYLIAAGIAAVAVTVSAIVIKKVVSRKRKETEEDDEPDQLRALLEQKKLAEDLPGEIILNETRAQVLKRQIKEFSVGNPDIVAQLLRTWLKEE